VVRKRDRQVLSTTHNDNKKARRKPGFCF